MPERFPRELVESLSGGRLMAFVGAGLSVRAGYPSWSELLVHLHAEAARCQDWLKKPLRGDDVLWRAQEYRDAMGEAAYREFLTRTFSRAEDPCDPGLDAVVGLPFRHILTTNYDSALEAAHRRVHGDEPRSISWGDRDAFSRFLVGLGSETFSRHYLHVHGRVEEPEGIVLTDSDYTDRYLRDHDAGRKLFAILSTQRIVFVGFSLNDPELALLLREVRSSVDAPGTRHFGIFSLNEADESQSEPIMRSRLKGKYGIEPIFYPWTPEHGHLVELLRALADRLAGVTEPPVEEALLGARIAAEPFPDDPQKGRWGGLSEAGGRALTARVEEIPGTADWFRVTLTVAPTPGAPALDGPVVFHLHDSFIPSRRLARPVAGRGEISLAAYGAFTVGAEADEGATRLELDLADLPDAPETFRRR